MSRFRLAFVDDHPIFLDGLDAICAARSTIKVVAKGRCADDAIKIAKRGAAELIVIDLNMPGDAFAAIAHIRQANSAIKLLAFTASLRVDHAVKALEVGANGYILKGGASEELFEAIRLVMAGETYITPVFASKVISALRQPSRQPQSSELSVREVQILRLLLHGLSNKGIAGRLDISEKTVKHYMTILMQKMQAKSRLEVVLAAQRAGHVAAPSMVPELPTIN